jgi:tetratricopeptide (TPR) repeat protein
VTGDPAWQARAEAYGLFGDVGASSHPDRSKEAYRRSLEIAREWVAARPSQESRSFLSRAMNRLGEVLRATGDLHGSLDAKMAALRIIDELRKEQPENLVWVFRRNDLCVGIGKATGHPSVFNLGDRKSAATWFREVLASYQKMSEEDPNDLTTRGRVAATFADLATVIGDSEPVEAERLFRRSFSVSDSVLQATPQDAEFREEEAYARIAFASVLRKLGKRGEAIEEQKKALETLGGLHEKDPAHVEFGLDLGEALDAFAADRLAAGDAHAAEEALNRSLDILRPILGANPRSLYALRDLADCHQALGDLAASRSDWDRAGVEYRASLNLWEHWKDIGTSSAYDQARRDHAARLAAEAARKSLRTSASH